MSNAEFAHGVASLNVVGGPGSAPYEVGLTGVVRGAQILAPSNASTINTGTPVHEFHANIESGVLAIDGVLKNIAAQADVDVSKAADASPIVDTQSIIYVFGAYLSPGDRTIRVFSQAGIAAVHASVARPTAAAIETALGLSSGTLWFLYGETRLKCTGATTVTQDINNAVAPILVSDKRIVVPTLSG